MKEDHQSRQSIILAYRAIICILIAVSKKTERQSTLLMFIKKSGLNPVPEVLGESHDNSEIEEIPKYCPSI